MRNLIGIVLLIMASRLGLSQTPDSLLYGEIEQVVVTGQFHPLSPEKTVVPVKVITAEELKNIRAFRLREALFLQLGFDLTQASVFGTSSSIHGVSKENIKILVNGVPVVGRLDGVIDLNQINLDYVNRVEIIEGPTSAYYGTDAIGGIINIITENQGSEKFLFALGAQYESIDAVDLNAKGHFTTGQHSFQLSGSTNNAAGVSFNDDRALDWEKRKQYSAALDYIYYMKDWQAHVRSSYANDKLTDRGVGDTNGIAEDFNYRTKRLVNSIILSGNTSSANYMELSVSNSNYNRELLSYTTDLNSGISNLSDATNHDTTKFNTWHIRGTYSYSPTDEKLHILAGAEFSREHTTGQRILNRKQHLSDLAAFSAIKYFPVPALTIEPSLRLTHYSYGENVATPAISSKYQLNDHNKIWASYAHGFRSPSLKELYLDFRIAAGPFTYHITGNEKLKPETSDHIQLGYKFNNDIFGKPGSLEVKAHYNNMKDLIALSPLENFSRHYININSDVTYGLQAELALKPVRNLSLDLGHHLFQNKNDLYGTSNGQTDKWLLSSDLVSSLTYSMPYQKGGATLRYKMRGQRRGYYYSRPNDTYYETQTKGMHLVDAHLNKKVANDLLNVGVGVRNILNQNNLEEKTISAGSAHETTLFSWGRSFYIGLDLNLQPK